MNREDLFKSINELDDRILEQSESPVNAPEKPLRRRFGLAAACLVIVIVAVYAAGKSGLFNTLLRFGGSSSGGGEKNGGSYMYYAGPVFPLSAMEVDPDITAERIINYDFENSFGTKSKITDDYTVLNQSSEDKAITLLYPFAACLESRLPEIPVITVNGTEVVPEPHIGTYPGTFTGATGGENDETTFNLSEPDSWEKYRSLIGSGYINSAFDGFPELEQPVIVYEIKDRYGECSDAAPAPMLNMEFNIDYDKTTILTYGFNSVHMDINSGYCARGTSIPQPSYPEYGQSAYLIVLGEDIGEYELKAYTNGACDKEMKNAGGTVLRYESTLGDIFSTVAGLYYDIMVEQTSYEGETRFLSGVSKEEFTGLAAEMMCSYGPLSEDITNRYSAGELEEIMSDTYTVRRIIYLSIPVTIPANGSIAVSACMEKLASVVFTGKNTGRRGYDMVTGLGSNVSFTKQTAMISNTEAIEIIEQNFGFDPENGITVVELDLTEPHYYLEVRKKEE
ncbi:MAG: hypothetical protein J5728_09625 [Lachnospiraceae bacterium]|nr:hypothetical protein [Lachnospiraceae bacterium]